MKTAGIREFKAQLSQYLREVQTGETILLTDRGRVVAEVRPPGAAAVQLLTRQEQARQEMIASGALVPAKIPPGKRPKGWTIKTSVRLPPGTVDELIREDRGDDE